MGLCQLENARDHEKDLSVSIQVSQLWMGAVRRFAYQFYLFPILLATPPQGPCPSPPKLLSCSLVLYPLPQSLQLAIAAEVAAPLAKTEEIVLLGGDDRTTAEVSRLVGQIPPAMHALTGVDVSKHSSVVYCSSQDSVSYLALGEQAETEPALHLILVKVLVKLVKLASSNKIRASTSPLREPDITSKSMRAPQDGQQRPTSCTPQTCEQLNINIKLYVGHAKRAGTNPQVAHHKLMNN
ncbi:unnamed protein product, partial [Timema podura]|nr:unnamed protein product [Timema podura]